MTGVPDVRRDAVSRWFEQHIEGVSLPLTFQLITGGRSNITYRVRDAAGRQYVLRRPPLGSVLETAHDMGREWRVLSGLAGQVPVPPPLGLCADVEVTGAVFHVTSFVDGLVLRSSAEAAELPAEVRQAISRSFVEGLAAMHLVPPDAVGLGDLGRRTGYLERQIRRWNGQYEKSRDEPIPEIDRVHGFLVATLPEDRSASVVHADYRLDNAIFGRDGSLRAIVDWELSTLGDPLADLATLLIFWPPPGEPSGMGFEWPTSAGGFLSRDEMVSLYEKATGVDAADTDYYLAFAHWRAACIGIGALARLRARSTGVDEEAARADIGIVARALRHQATMASEAAERCGT